ncbi:hypothetical protein R1sor_020787 [Riccia sorocarpa]|uniref:CCHC-type domain-containing protein n=1 Tax=Riccia sorocarpa TaxID=122646 RepID=A0ABD3GIU7_9MARC
MRHQKNGWNEDEADPYLKHVNPQWGHDVTDEELFAAYKEFRKFEVQSEGKAIKTIDVDPWKAKARVAQLNKDAVILHTMDLMPLQDKVEEWAGIRLHQDLGVNIVQIRALSKKHFLIILQSEEEKHTVLTDPPLYMYKENDEMLGSLGRVLHKDIHRHQNSHVHISACVLIDLSQELTDTLRVRSNGQVILEQVIHYKGLPYLCFYCQDRGHWIKDCPKKNSEEANKQAPRGDSLPIPQRQDQHQGDRTGRRTGYVAPRDEGFQKVNHRKSRRGKWVPRSGVLDKGFYRVRNAYELLNKDEVEDEQEPAVDAGLGKGKEKIPVSEEDSEGEDTQEEDEELEQEVEEEAEDRMMDDTETADENGNLNADPKSSGSMPQNLQKIDEDSEEGTEEETENTKEGGNIPVGSPGGKLPGTMTTNGIFSPDAQVTAKKRGCEDARGNRRQSIHQTRVQTRLYEGQGRHMRQNPTMRRSKQ